MKFTLHKYSVKRLTSIGLMKCQHLFIKLKKTVFRNVMLNIHTNVLQHKCVLFHFYVRGKVEQVFMLQHFEGLVYVDLFLFFTDFVSFNLMINANSYAIIVFIIIWKIVWHLKFLIMKGTEYVLHYLFWWSDKQKV